VIDDPGDRKDGTATAHVGHQWLGRYGKSDNGGVTVTTVWADDGFITPRMRCPTPRARHFAKGKSDPAFRTKLAIGADLAVRARAAGLVFRAVAADSAYGDQDGFRGELAEAGLPFVMALKPRRGTWAYGAGTYTPADAARALAWNGPEDPGDWQAVTRALGDGRTGTWHAAVATLGWWGPDGFTRLVVATADPGTLPGKATWYLATNLPRPGSRREDGSPHPAASLAEITRIYGIRHWIGQSCKQVKDQLGWAGFQVRSDTAIRPRPAGRARREHRGPGSRSSPRTRAGRPRARRPRAAPGRGRTPARDHPAGRTPGIWPGPAGHGRSGGCGPGRWGAAGSGCSERPCHHSNITLSDPGRLKNARSLAQSGGVAAVGPHRADVTYACRKVLLVVACYLSGPVAGFMHPLCRRGAGLVATSKSGADAGSVFASGGQAAVSAVCVAAQVLWVPVSPPNISVRLHTEAVGGQGTGRLERLPPAITAAAAPRPSPRRPCSC
jgi:hypothetical protein